MHRVIDYALTVLLFLTALPLWAQPRSLDANGQQLTYIEAGAGPSVVLVHGSVADYREWARQIEPLAARYRVIAYSRRYHWPNAAPGQNADATLPRQAEDLAALIEALKIAPAHVVGHSYGGATALLLARRRPDLVHTLVLAEPAVGGVLGELAKDDPLAKEGQEVRVAVREAIASGSAERIVSTYAARVAPGEFEKATGEARDMLLANVAAFQLDFGSPRPPFNCDDARLVEAPTLVIAGGRSAMGLQRIAETLARCLKAGQLAKLPTATHWMQSDQPQAFNEAVLGFLSKH